MLGRSLLIGECMVELRQAEGGPLRKGFAGDTFNTADYLRAFLPESWTVERLRDLWRRFMCFFME
jgi:2-dehydro-3-deoxygluconokinase